MTGENGIVEQLKREAQKQGLTQQEWADKADMTRGQLATYLTRGRQPGAVVIERLANALGCKWKLKKQKTVQSRHEGK